MGGNEVLHWENKQQRLVARETEGRIKLSLRNQWMSIAHDNNSKYKLEFIFLGCPDSGVVLVAFRDFGKLNIHGFY